MFWRKQKDIRSRTLSKGEVEAYRAGFDDGVRVVIDQIIELDPSHVDPEVKELVKRLITAHAFETTNSAKVAD